MKPTVTKATEEQEKESGSWPVWDHYPDTFDYEYDEKEEFYVVQGKAVIHTDEGETHFEAGDYVVMPKGMKCKWHILEKVVKHYKFG
jgi:hypothetical protein